MPTISSFWVSLLTVVLYPFLFCVRLIARVHPSARGSARTPPHDPECQRSVGSLNAEEVSLVLNVAHPQYGSIDQTLATMPTFAVANPPPLQDAEEVFIVHTVGHVLRGSIDQAMSDAVLPFAHPPTSVHGHVLSSSLDTEVPPLQDVSSDPLPTVSPPKTGATLIHPYPYDCIDGVNKLKLWLALNPDILCVGLEYLSSSNFEVSDVQDANHEPAPTVSLPSSLTPSSTTFSLPSSLTPPSNVPSVHPDTSGTPDDSFYSLLKMCQSSNDVEMDDAFVDLDLSLQSIPDEYRMSLPDMSPADETTQADPAPLRWSEFEDDDEDYLFNPEADESPVLRVVLPSSSKAPAAVRKEYQYPCRLSIIEEADGESDEESHAGMAPASIKEDEDEGEGEDKGKGYFSAWGAPYVPELDEGWDYGPNASAPKKLSAYANILPLIKCEYPDDPNVQIEMNVYIEDIANDWRLDPDGWYYSFWTDTEQSDVEWYQCHQLVTRWYGVRMRDADKAFETFDGPMNNDWDPCDERTARAHQRDFNEFGTVLDADASLERPRIDIDFVERDCPENPVYNVLRLSPLNPSTQTPVTLYEPEEPVLSSSPSEADSSSGPPTPSLDADADLDAEPDLAATSTCPHSEVSGQSCWTCYYTRTYGPYGTAWYFDQNGQLVVGAAPCYYDENGYSLSQPYATQYYEADDSASAQQYGTQREGQGVDSVGQPYGGGYYYPTADQPCATQSSHDENGKDALQQYGTSASDESDNTAVQSHGAQYYVDDEGNAVGYL